MRQLLRLFIAWSLVIWQMTPVVTFAQSPSTYYIDYVGGSNAHDGLSQGSAWKSMPGMQTNTSCAGATHTYTHVTGDKFLFKGGVTWPAACFNLFVTKGGTPTTQDYIGVCNSAYSTSPCSGGTSWPTTGWTRPLFDLNFTLPTGGTVITGSVTTSGYGYITFDGLEIAHQGVNVALGIDQQQAYSFRNYSSPSNSPLGIIITHNFIHDWGSTTTLTSTNQGDYSAGSIHGNVTVDNTEISDANGWMVVSTTAAHFGGGVRGVTNNVGVSEVRFSKIHDGMAGCFSVRSCHDNEFFNQLQPTGDPGGALIHSQVIEDDDGWGPSDIYRNLIHDENAGVVIDVCQGASIYENVIYNNSNNFGIRLAGTGGGSCGSNITSIPSTIDNNTIDCSGSASVCFGTDSHTGASVTGNVNLQNNIWVTNGPGNPVSINEPITGLFTNTNNYTMPTSEASTFGFTIANKYNPTTSDSHTVGQGINFTLSVSGHLSQLAIDPEGTIWYGGSSQTKVANTGSGTCGGTASATPCWDLGPYKFPAAGTTGPTVIITAPTNGATGLNGTVTVTGTCAPQGSATIQANSFQLQVDGLNYGSPSSTSPISVPWDTTQASNANHTLFLSCTDSNGLSGGSTVFTVGVSNTICLGGFVADVPWTQNATIPVQTSIFTITWVATPFSNSNLQDTIQGLSNGAAAKYADLATSIRFSSNGQIQVLDSTTYRADNVVNFTANTSYSLSETVNLVTHTYSAQLTSPSNVTLCASCAFRNTQTGVTQIDHFNGESSSATPNTVKDCSITIGGTPLGASCTIVGNTIVLKGVTIH